MARVSKLNSSRVRPPLSQSVPEHEIDEALWAAYRRYDKSAVTEALLRRYLPGLTSAVNGRGLARHQLCRSICLNRVSFAFGAPSRSG